MNPDTILQSLQKGFHMTLGATTSLVESLQDPQKREENLSRLTNNFSELAEEWVEKGAVTEREARSFVDGMLAQQSSPTPENSTPGSKTVDTTVSVVADVADVAQDLRTLTEEIVALRSELEQVRNQPNS